MLAAIIIIIIIIYASIIVFDYYELWFIIIMITTRFWGLFLYHFLCLPVCPDKWKKILDQCQVLLGGDDTGLSDLILSSDISYWDIYLWFLTLQSRCHFEVFFLLYGKRWQLLFAQQGQVTEVPHRLFVKKW